METEHLGIAASEGLGERVTCERRLEKGAGGKEWLGAYPGKEESR